MIKQILQKTLKNLLGHSSNNKLLMLPRNAHNISRKNISNNALKVLNRLHKAGRSAYLVGGSVRDLLLNKEPKDYDVATDAKPEEVRKLFNNCRLIGRRFRLVHIYFYQDIIEVATFRASHSSSLDKRNSQGMIIRDNVYGSVEEDALRRDFTINALYYNIANFSVVDFTGQGIRDLEKGLIRVIGVPTERYKEDPVRMLRAVRFAAKLNFTMEPLTAKPLPALAHLLNQIPRARIFDELLKLFNSGNMEASFILLRQYKLFSVLFPEVNECLDDDDETIEDFLRQVFRDTDERIKENKSINSGFLFAALLWCPMIKKSNTFEQKGQSYYSAKEQAINDILHSHGQHLAIPRRMLTFVREVWYLRFQFKKHHPKKALRLLSHPYFRAAYDFLLLQAINDKECSQELQWWENFIRNNKSELSADAKKNFSDKKIVNNR